VAGSPAIFPPVCRRNWLAASLRDRWPCSRGETGFAAHTRSEDATERTLGSNTRRKRQSTLSATYSQFYQRKFNAEEK
jgi:hypothetical protein